MRFIVRFSQNHYLRVINNWILLVYFLSYLTKNITYSIVKSISFNLDMAIKVKILKY